MTSPTDSAAAGLARRGVVALAVVAVLAQLVVLYWPVVTVEGPVSWTDKVVHLLVFAVPTYAVGRALRSVRAAVLVFAIHAPVSELVQQFLLPGRSGDGWDVVLDLVGVAVGAAALMVGTRPLRW
ncbi:VanZ family protein [Humibacillus xanthopallidus]|uniref:VanZ family protein n=1 Tax=Humibacillus xanthopallidus TaxID=412689 RepID=UPI00384C8B87